MSILVNDCQNSGSETAETLAPETRLGSHREGACWPRAQHKAAEAAEVEARFKQAWAAADVTLTASRF